MVTFSDCMTLLLTFFVLLLSFSSFDKEVFDEFKTTLAGGFPSVSLAGKYSRDASSLIERMRSRQYLEQGGDRPTHEQGTQARVKTETKVGDFHGHKVFLTSSEKIFWGKGTTISSEGHTILATLALFLAEVQGRPVISESLPGSDSSDRELGLARAWAVMELLTTTHGLDKNRFSISASGTVAPVSFSNSELGTGAQRVLEIALLERSIYR
jgi:chemotaxis protein MotB